MGMGRLRIASIVLGFVAAAGCNDAQSSDDSDDGEETDASTAEDGSTDHGDTDAPTSGDSGTSSDDGPIEVDFETDVQPIFNANCTCHLQGMSGTMQAPFMTLNPGTSYGQLVDVASEQVPTMDRIEPGDPDHSYLWHKVNDTHLTVSGSGTSMPPGVGGVSLDADTLAVLEAWILGGAEP